MPITKSAKKALRVAKHKTSINRHRKEVLKAAVKNAEGEGFDTAVSLIDKAAKWGIIHPNKAARLKSRLAKNQGAEKPKAAKAAPKKATKTPAKTKKTTKK